MTQNQEGFEMVDYAARESGLGLQEHNPEVLTNVGEAFEKILGSDSRVYIPGNSADMPWFNHALAEYFKSKKDITDVDVVQLLGGVASNELMESELYGRVRMEIPFAGGSQRQMFRKGLGNFVPMHLREVSKWLENGNGQPEGNGRNGQPDVAFIQVAPADEKGNFNLGVCTGLDWAALHGAKKVVAIVNHNMPSVSGPDAEVPKEMIDYVVDVGAEYALPEHAQGGKPDELVKEIAKNVATLIPDGATMQAGIGEVPDAVFDQLGKMHRKNLHVHSEMVSDGIIPLVESSTVDDVKIGFVVGTRKLYDYVAGEKKEVFTFEKQKDVNDPAKIGEHKDMIAINTCLMVDLFGQGYADSLGMKHISGAGGQVDFARGAAESEGGKFVLAIKSKDKNGSKIVFRPSEPTSVTALRYDTDWVATENGSVKLKSLDMSARAMALIAIAAPEYRDELFNQAISQSLITREVDPAEIPIGGNLNRESLSGIFEELRKKNLSAVPLPGFEDSEDLYPHAA